MLDRRHAPETDPEPDLRRPLTLHVKHGATRREVGQEVERGRIIRQQDVACAPELHVVEQPAARRMHICKRRDVPKPHRQPVQPPRRRHPMKHDEPRLRLHSGWPSDELQHVLSRLRHRQIPVRSWSFASAKLFRCRSTRSLPMAPFPAASHDPPARAALRRAIVHRLHRPDRHQPDHLAALA
jgi:hypothetical protein